MAHDTHGDGHEKVGHLVPVRYLVVTGVALLILTIITVVTAQFDFGSANIYIAMAIAGVKASLVVLFFMHLRWDRPFHSFVLVTSIAFVVLFITFALTDKRAYRESVIPGDGTAVQERLAEIATES